MAELQIVTARRELVQFISFYRTPDTFKDTDIAGFATSHIAYFESPTSKEYGCQVTSPESPEEAGKSQNLAILSPWSWE